MTYQFPYSSSVDVPISDVVDLLEDDATDDDIAVALDDYVHETIQQDPPQFQIHGRADFIEKVRAALVKRAAEAEVE